MKLALNSELWGYLYYNLREEYYRLKGDMPESRIDIQNFLKYYSIEIKTDIDGRWEEVEIVLSDEELTLFLLKWAT